MAVIFTWSGDGLTAGSFSPATSIGTGDTAFSGVYGTSSKLTIANSGVRAPRLAIADSPTTAGGAYWDNGSNLTDYAVRFYFVCSGYSASVSGAIATGLRTTGETSWRFDVSTTGAIRFRGDLAAAAWSPSSSLSTATVYRIEIVVTGSTSGVVSVYQGDSFTALYTSPAVAVGAGMSVLRIGENGSDNLQGKYYDDIAVGNAAASLGPKVAPTTITAGEDQTDIEPFSTVTLAASVVTGSVTSWSWSQISGPAVTLNGSESGRTFIAPANANGATLVFQASGDGSTDQVSVQVLPHLEWIKRSSGAITPMYRG